MNRCVDVAEIMIESKEWERSTKVFDIAQTILEERSGKTNLNTAKKLANLERQIPFIENNVERMVKIHQRLIRAAKGDKKETLNICRRPSKIVAKK